MSVLMTRITVVVLMLALVALVSVVTGVDAQNVQESVTGHVGYVVPANGAHIRYSVNAVRHRDGTVSGEFELHATTATGAPLAHTHVTITCFTIAGNIARIGGVVDRSNFAPPGTPGYITVVDNGEGANDPPDLASSPNIGPGTDIAHCVTGFPQTLFSVDQGNIQIRPSGF